MKEGIIGGLDRNPLPKAKVKFKHWWYWLSPSRRAARKITEAYLNSDECRRAVAEKVDQAIRELIRVGTVGILYEPEEWGK